MFERMTQLDLTGPYEVLASLPDARTVLIARTLDPVRSDRGLRILPDATYDTAADVDILMIPGGAGTSALLNDDVTLAFVRRSAARARYVTSVCTGSLVLAAAGLLQGRRAATHWASRQYLTQLGAIAVAARTVIDLPYVTGGGVTAGIDFAFALIVELYGREVAERIALSLEYDPQPPVSTGTPEHADPALVAAHYERARAVLDERAAAVAAACRRLAERRSLH